MRNHLTAEHFQTEEAAFAYVEAKLWANGPVCHHCGETSRIGRLQGKTNRARFRLAATRRGAQPSRSPPGRG